MLIGAGKGLLADATRPHAPGRNSLVNPRDNKTQDRLFLALEEYQNLAFRLEKAMGKTIRVRFHAEKENVSNARDEWVLLVAPRIVYEVVSE